MKKGQLTLIPTPLDETSPINEEGSLIIKNILNEDKNCKVLVESHKSARKRWISSNLPREYIEDFIIYSEQNQSQICDNVIQEMKNGTSFLIMSDSGLPALMDPGTELVYKAHKEELKVTSLPHDCSISLSMALSGLIKKDFLFRGFLPRKEGRSKELKDLLHELKPQLIMETPYRLERLLSELSDIGLKRDIFIGADMAMPEEELFLGNVKNAMQKFRGQKREFIIIIEGKK